MFSRAIKMRLVVCISTVKEPTLLDSIASCLTFLASSFIILIQCLNMLTRFELRRRDWTLFSNIMVYDRDVGDITVAP